MQYASPLKGPPVPVGCDAAGEIPQSGPHTPPPTEAFLAGPRLHGSGCSANNAVTAHWISAVAVQGQASSRVSLLLQFCSARKARVGCQVQRDREGLPSSRVAAGWVDG
jgi:hypothetical protein